MKNVAVLMEDEAFALFFCPHPGGVPTPGKFAIQGKKTLMPGGQPGGGEGVWAQLELTDA